MSEIIIVDYGCGNISSIERALERLDISCKYSSDHKVIEGAKRIILPGVGAYSTGMRNLEKMGLVEIIKGFANSGKPMLGICLGMQLLLDYSEEFGNHRGLEIIPGKVTMLRPNNKSKVPHIGWNSVETPKYCKKKIWNEKIMSGVRLVNDCYFVHSYIAKTYNDINNIAETEYGGERFSSVIGKENVYGFQFHPEKSGYVGLKMLKNFFNAYS